MVKLLKRTTDNKYLKSIETDVWVDSMDNAFEMTYRECESAKNQLIGTYQPEQLKKIVLFNKTKSISNEEKKELLDLLKNNN